MKDILQNHRNNTASTTLLLRHKHDNLSRLPVPQTFLYTKIKWFRAEGIQSPGNPFPDWIQKLESLR